MIRKQEASEDGKSQIRKSGKGFWVGGGGVGRAGSVSTVCACQTQGKVHVQEESFRLTATGVAPPPPPLPLPICSCASFPQFRPLSGSPSLHLILFSVQPLSLPPSHFSHLPPPPPPPL